MSVVYRPIVLVIALCAVISLHGVTFAQDRPVRILTLFPYYAQVPVVQTIEAKLRQRFSALASRRTDVYSDYLDFARFPSPDFEARTAQYLADKYATNRPDIVMAFGYFSLRFSERYREMIAPGVPLIVVADSISPQDISRIGNATGVSVREDLTKTLDLARQLQPQAKLITVVSGGSRRDQAWAARAREQLAQYADHYEIKYMDGLPYEDVLRQVKELPRNSILLLTTMFTDGAGEAFSNPDVVENISKASSAPAYAPYQTYLGRGIVGAHVISFDSWGTVAADLAIDSLNRLRDGRPLPAPSLLDTGTNEVDARALARWGLDESNLPAGTNIRFAEPSIWREHRNWILAVCAAIILQSILITGLIYEHRRRRLAEVKERLRIKELALMNRRAAIGQMSASIAHEIKQPLSAILANSDVALHWLRKQTPDTAEISSAVESIAEDTLRANNIIDSVRAMFKNDDTLHDPLDINAVLRDVLTLLRVELIEHKIILRLGLQNDIAHMPADRAQMQQVFLNLIRNAIEAMQQVKDRPRQLRILSGVTESKEIVVTIEDNGQGVAPDVLARLFEPFVTTKGSGMGMGLSICRSIIESHGGHLSARAAMPHGAVFEITLPLPHND